MGKRHKGAPPGTLLSDPEAPQATIGIVAYGPDLMERRDVEAHELSELRGKHDVLWVNVVGVGDVDVVQEVGRCFDLHALALEDVMHVVQRPKMEQYDDYLFIVARMDTIGEGLETEQLSMFLGEGFVVTFQEQPGDCFDPVRERIEKSRGQIRAQGPDYLAYALLDAAPDQLTPLVEVYGDKLSVLEEEIMRGRDPKVVERLLDINHDLDALRRITAPLRDTLLQLQGDGVPIVKEDTRVYFRDCHDHATQMLDSIDSWRTFGTNLMSVHLAVSSQELNSAMKVLTVIATIFIPLSFVSGVYGMNFNSAQSPFNMPELNWYFGYPFALALMAAVAFGQLFYFWRKGWMR